MDEKRRDQLRSMVGRAVDTALVPFQAAISKPAQKAYLGTAFFAITSIFLLCVASAAYWIFYFSYIPQVGIDRVIHLQFGDGNPFGTTALSSLITSQQAYDITLFLHLPHTPSNVAAGNFMLDLALLAPSDGSTPPTDSLIPSISTTGNISSSVLARSRRPAILTYNSPLVTTAHTLTTLPWYVLGWRRESEVLAVPMFEGVQFAKPRFSIPDVVKVTIEPDADANMQFYDVGVRIVARFGGLRWILYHHKFISFFIFTGLFWSSSMFSMLLVWLGLTLYFTYSSSSGNEQKTQQKEDQGFLSQLINGGIPTLSNGKPIKSEPLDSEDALFDPTSVDDLSDTSRTFPSLAKGQAPLHFKKQRDSPFDFADPKTIKSENGVAGEDQSLLGSMPAFAGPGGGEADDEDEDEDYTRSREEERRELLRSMGVRVADVDDYGEGSSQWRDSGIGTSREEGAGRDELRRRGSGRVKKEGGL